MLRAKARLLVKFDSKSKHSKMSLENRLNCLNLNHSITLICKNDDLIELIKNYVVQTSTMNRNANDTMLLQS